MTWLPPVSAAGRMIGRRTGHTLRRARHGAALAVGTRPSVGRSPYDVVWRRGRTELRHHHSVEVRVSPPVLVVPSLVSRSYILDLMPGNSFVEHLVRAGFDVYLLDWGVPDRRDAENRLEDYVDDHLRAAIERIRQLAGADRVHLLGYCFGGVLALLHAAHHPRAPLASVTVMATPVDYRHAGPLAEVFRTGHLEVDHLLDGEGNVPARTIARAFRSLTPTSPLRRWADLWEQLGDAEYVAVHRAMTAWTDDHVPFAGAAARQAVQMLVRDNAMITDRLVVGGDPVSLSTITFPFLSVLAARDHIVREHAARPVLDLVGSADRNELRLDAGHIGLVVGRTAARSTLPPVLAFLRAHSSDV